MNKKALVFLIILVGLAYLSSMSYAQSEDVPLAKYLHPVQLDSMDVILLAIDILYQDEMAQARMHVLTDAFNSALSKTGLFTTGQVDLSKLDLFNYSLRYLEYDDSTNKIEMVFDISENILNTRTTEGLKQFMASCFSPLSEVIGRVIPEFDVKRDLRVGFYSVQDREKRVGKYENGEYVL